MESRGRGESVGADHGWDGGERQPAAEPDHNQPLQLTTVQGKRQQQLSNGSVDIFPVQSGSPTSASDAAGSLANNGSAVAALPVRFVVEFVDVPPDDSTVGRRRIHDYAIIPSSTRFSEVAARVLQKCGLEHTTLSESTAFLALKNWKPLSLDQISSSDSHTVADILGDVINTATLRIFCRASAAGQQTAEVRERLLRLLLTQGRSLLAAAGCPLDQETLTQLTSESLPNLPADTLQLFNQWYDTQKQARPAPSEPEVNSGQCQSAFDHFHQCSKPRVRTSFDMEYEIPHLQKWYSINPHPNKMQMQYFMEELNVYRAGRNRKPLEINNIIYWFKNSRAAQKKYEQRALTGPISPAPPASDEDDCSLSASEEPEAADDARMSSSEHLNDAVKQEEASDTEERHDSATSGSPQGYQAGAGYPTSLSSPYINHMTSSHFERIGYNVDPSVFRQSMSMYMSGCLQGLPGVPYPSVPMTPELQRKRNRTFIDPISEVPLLEKWFSMNTHPCHTTILQYTDELNRQPYRHKFPKLEPKNVQFWFKNRRAKNKRLRSAMWTLSPEKQPSSAPGSAMNTPAKMADTAEAPPPLKAM